MGTISLPLPVVGSPDATEEPKIPSALSTIETWANGNIDTTNLSAALLATIAQAGLAFVTVLTSSSVSAGQLIGAAGGITITLPAPTANTIVGVIGGANTTATNPVTVAYGSGAGAILGVGISAGVSSFPIGTLYGTVILRADGTNWYIVSGKQDGWVSFGVPTGASGGVLYARLTGDRVDLRGHFTGTPLSNSFTVTLSSVFRPAATRYFPVYQGAYGGSGGNTNPSGGNITTGGLLTLYANSNAVTTEVGVDGSFYHL
jgi:hypothetical protein